MHTQEVANAVACPMTIIEANIPQGSAGKGLHHSPWKRGDLWSAGWTPDYWLCPFLLSFSRPTTRMVPEERAP